MLMTPGENTSVPTDALIVRVISNSPADISAFCLYADGKVSGDADMIFYGNKRSNDQTVVLVDEGTNTTFTVNLPKVNQLIQKVAFSCTCNPGQVVSSLGRLSIQIEHNNSVLLQANIDLKGRTEAALILGELYRRNNEWKFRFTSQGFNGGLKPLAEFYGIEIAEDQTPPTSTAQQPNQKPIASQAQPSQPRSTFQQVQQPIVQQAAVNLSKVSLTKNNPTINLTKRNTYGLIKVNLNWHRDTTKSKGMFNGAFGNSGIDLDLGAFIRLKSGRTDIVQALGNAFGSTQSSPFVHLLADDKTGTSSTGEWMHINGEHWKEIDEILVFAFIYKGVPDWTKTDGVVTIQVPNEPPVETRLTEGGRSNNMCAVARLTNQDGALRVQRLDTYFAGHKALDDAYGWGFNWRTGTKDGKEGVDIMSFFNKIKDAINSGREELTSQVGRFKNRKFMEGTVAVCAYISMASSGASSEEKQKMIAFIQQSPELKVFDTKEIITFFNSVADSFAFDSDIGKGEAMKFIMRLKDQPEAAQLALRVGIAVAKSDGDFDNAEKEVAREICSAFGFTPSDYQL